VTLAGAVAGQRNGLCGKSAPTKPDALVGAFAGFIERRRLRQNATRQQIERRPLADARGSGLNLTTGSVTHDEGLIVKAAQRQHKIAGTLSAAQTSHHNSVPQPVERSQFRSSTHDYLPQIGHSSSPSATSMPSDDRHMQRRHQARGLSDTLVSFRILSGALKSLRTNLVPGVRD
jgi:hypothetical protein